MADACANPEPVLGAVSMQKLYELALAEGEGLGTAYEYYVKWRLYRRLMKKWSLSPENILIAGLPEKYGCGMDALILADLLCARTVLVAQDEDKFSQFERIYADLVRERFFPNQINLQVVPPGNWREAGRYGPFDLVISSGLIQAYPAAQRAELTKELALMGKHLALFVPNASNIMHASGVGAGRMTLGELVCLVTERNLELTAYGYVDMPPFPSGVKRSNKDGAADSFPLRVMQAILYTWSIVEAITPRRIRKPFSHIAYVAAKGASKP